MSGHRRGLAVDYDTVYVAVCEHLKDCRSTLRWVLQQNLSGKEVCIVYVDVPAQTIPTLSGRNVPASQAGAQELAVFRERERVEMVRVRDFYVDTCSQVTGVNPKGISHSASSIEKGIVEVVSQNRAGRLVMGAAADSGYSSEMVEPMSEKAKYVHQHAPSYCKIQFICRGKLISTREGVEPSNHGIEPEGSGIDDLYDQLEQAISKTENSRREIYEESMRRQKTEIEAICKDYLANRLRDIELERDNALQEVELLRRRDIELDNALKEAQQLRKQLAERTSPTPSIPKSFSYYSSSDIENATNNFDESLIIGEGGYGFIYKGMLGDTEVAIKVPKLEGQQGRIEFQREIDVLSNLRHPNLVTLVGACYESQALIYGYLHGGSLEDRIKCKDGSPPLSWQTRIKIGTELCSVLVFLHSNSPKSIIHGDLKPANILLDENMVCKLSDFGICRLTSRTEEFSTKQNTSFFTGPRGTHFYMDPEFFTTGMLSFRSDVYAVGVILLQLLTGKKPESIADLVQAALASGDFKSILDPLAGEWPSDHVEELARVALSCCEMRKRDRLDLADVWRFLKLILASCIGLSSHQRVSEDAPPTYFLCPIFQEIMEDPHIAADGFTYEKKAIEGWLAFDRNSSPITNKTLQHTHIVPNLDLQSAIQEWLQRNNTA